MKYLKLSVSLIFVLLIAGCSTIRTTGEASGVSEITSDKTYQLRVRSGNIFLDRLIYDYASKKFGEYLRISDKGPFNGYVEIVFSNASKNSLSGSTAGYAGNIIYGDSWYTGDDAPWAAKYYQAPGTEIGPGGKLSWHNSAAVLTITDGEANNLWKAYYNYRGGSELTGLFVKTADEAARLSLDRIMEQFEKEFILVPQSAPDEAREKNKEIYLIINEPGPGDEDSAGEQPVSGPPAGHGPASL
ncbi:MAG: hypothetical protein HZA16_03445 [Nitrospirae bacterium]|nr:hypothetical protein [Nitrospirota bacterium]